MIVLAICQTPRGIDGFWYRATISFHAGGCPFPSSEVEIESFVIAVLSTKPRADGRPNPGRPPVQEIYAPMESAAILNDKYLCLRNNAAPETRGEVSWHLY